MTVLFAGMTMLLSVSSATAKPPVVAPAPPLEFTPPKPQRVTLSNGIVVYLLEDHELPIVTLLMRMKTTPADDLPGLTGGMEVMGSQWRAGGTKTRTPQVLNDELEYQAADITTSAGEENASISLSCLSKDLGKSLDIWSDVLFNPVFAESQLSLYKTTALEGLRRKNETPFSIGRRAFRDVTYGRTQYYAWNPTEEFIRKVKRIHLLELYRNVVTPDHAVIAVSGDFDSRALLADLEKRLGGWKPTGRVLAPFSYEPKDPPGGKIFLVSKDFTQSLIYIGGFGISRLHPDQYELTVADYILGAGGPSRLFAQVRSRLGLAYMVGSFFTMPKGPGLVGAVAQTKSNSTLTTIEALSAEIKRMSETVPAPAEMSLAKDSLINSFVFRFDSTGQIVQEQADLEFFGYPADYLDRYVGQIRAVGPEHVRSVAQTYYRLEKMKILVVGDEAKFERPLETLGTVTRIPLEQVD